MINDERFICFQSASFMASTSKTHPISIFDSIDIKEANLGVFLIDGNSKASSNVKVDIVWRLLFPFFQTNQAIWAPHHHNTSFWAFLCQTMVGLQVHVIHNNFDALYVI
jgi:hypothetical protein